MGDRNVYEIGYVFWRQQGRKEENTAKQPDKGRKPTRSCPYPTPPLARARRAAPLDRDWHSASPRDSPWVPPSPPSAPSLPRLLRRLSTRSGSHAFHPVPSQPHCPISLDPSFHWQLTQIAFGRCRTRPSVVAPMPRSRCLLLPTSAIRREDAEHDLQCRRASRCSPSSWRWCTLEVGPSAEGQAWW